jgi:hypothetical protein
MEAVGLANRIGVKYDPKGLHEFIVESREPATQHRLTRNMFDTWLQRPGGSPADVARKNRLNGLLGEVVYSRHNACGPVENRHSTFKDG